MIKKICIFCFAVIMCISFSLASFDTTTSEDHVSIKIGEFEFE